MNGFAFCAAGHLEDILGLCKLGYLSEGFLEPGDIVVFYTDGLTELTGKLRYQACTDKACLAPTATKFKVPVR